MDQSLVFTFMFAATAPIALMPAIISLFTRHEKRLGVLIANVALWAAAYFSIRSFLGPSDNVIIPAPVVAIAWVGLLAYVIRTSRSSAASGAVVNGNQA